MEQIGVNASGEKTRKIGAEQEHHGERLDTYQNIKKNVVRISERVVIKLLQSRTEQAV